MRGRKLAIKATVMNVVGHIKKESPNEGTETNYAADFHLSSPPLT